MAEAVSTGHNANRKSETVFDEMRVSAALDRAAFSTSVPHFPEFHSLLLMKCLVISITLAASAASLLAEDRPALKDTKDKVSYSIGLEIGGTFKQQKMELNTDALAAGVKDALTGAKPQLSTDEIQQVRTAWQKEMTEKMQVADKTAADKNKAEGEKFLADNKNKPGVKTTADGLQYKVLKEGSGASPKETDTVSVNYRGTLIDGTEFDSSFKRGEPATFPLNKVIKGWTEGVQLMKPGAKYQFFIPAALAYGERRVSADLGPNSTLIFEVELLNVNPAAGATPPAPSASASSSASASPSPR